MKISLLLIISLIFITCTLSADIPFYACNFINILEPLNYDFLPSPYLTSGNTATYSVLYPNTFTINDKYALAYQGF